MEDTEASGAAAISDGRLTLWNLSLDMMAILDRDGRFQLVNPAWERTLGYAADLLLGRQVHQIVTPELVDMVHRALADIVERGGGAGSTQVTVVDLEGRVRTLACWWRCEDGSPEIALLARDLTDLKNAEVEVARSSRYARSLIEASLDPLVTISADGVIMDVNAATEKATGVLRDELIGSDFSGYFTEPELAREGYQRVFSEGQVTDYPLAIRHVSGSVTDVVYNATVYLDQDGKVAGVFAAARDITALHEVEAELAAEAQLRIGMDRSAIGMCIASIEGRFLRVNPTLCEIMGRSAAELESLKWPAVTHPDDIEACASMLEALVVTGGSDRTLKRYLRPDGSIVWADVSVAAVTNAAGDVREFIGQFVDVTDRVNAERDLTELATRDTLTGLPNRAGLHREIERAIAVGVRSGRMTIVMMIDLDRFKVVNDSLGHTAGDELLRGVARRIEESVRTSDFVARLGGDEFVVVMRDVDGPYTALQVAWRITTDMRRPFRVGTTELFTTASVGVAFAGESSLADDLLAEADAAMYLAKNEGRDRVMVFNEELRAAATYRFTTEALLRRAIEHERLEVWYQPEVDLDNGEMTAVEALLRWHHPDGELYTADRFIGIAEETGLILEIGAWVIRSACQQAAHWARLRPERPLTVRINLSTLQVAEPTLLEILDDALYESGVDPRILCFEVTETALLRETPTAHTNLAGLHHRGVHIAVDDFGTGYASLAYLRDYPVDVVKIDRSFVSDIITSTRSRRLVCGILALSDALGLHVTAEGVEDEDQATCLRDLGCSSAQGYLYSKAVPASHITEALDYTFPHT